MLCRIEVENFLLVEKMQFDFKTGFTAITGETGSGKSMIFDALTLVLGGRAKQLSQGGTARIKAHFLINNALQVAALQQKTLTLSLATPLLDGDRLVFYREIGKKKLLKLNDQLIKLQEARAVADSLVFIHEQNHHQILRSQEEHRVLVDNFATLHEQLKSMGELAEEYHDCRSKVQGFLKDGQSLEKHIEWLRYQEQELDQCGDLSVEALEELESEYLSLSNSKSLLELLHEALFELTEDEQGLSNKLRSCNTKLQKELADQPKLQSSLELLEGACIGVDEAIKGLEDFVDSLDLSPEYVEQVVQRYDQLVKIAKKHDSDIFALEQLQEKISKELLQFDGESAESNIEHLQMRLADLEQSYHNVAREVSDKRLEASQKLDTRVNQLLAALGLDHCLIKTQLLKNEGKISPLGYDEVVIYLSTNSKLPMQPIQTVASGGEISRIMLAFQVALAESSVYGRCLIFDEVDIGFGGGVSEMVAKFLLNLSQQGNQVIIITHQAQIAAMADQQIRVDKSSGQVSWHELDIDERVQEVARMVAGKKVNAEAYEHAKALIRLNPNNQSHEQLAQTKSL